MKVPRPNPRQPRGFTLIELLVVISIIAILATIGVAGSNIVIRKAREVQAKTAMASVIIAIKGYKTEYFRLPTTEGAVPTEDNQAFDTSDEGGRQLLNVLLATDLTKNPRGQKFWEAPPAKNGAGYSTENGLRDPWAQNGYYLIMDYSGDGRITNPYAGSYKEEDELVADVIMYSAGANMKFEEGGGAGGGKSDDVKSW
jgi:prepilin-type N-terminal cleavage/methylation domain-containing protein